MNLVFKGFSQTSIPPLISVLHAKDGGGGGYHDFLLKNFCLTVAKKFVGEPFDVGEKFGYRNFSWIGEGGGGKSITISRRKFFYVTLPINFVGEPFGVSENFWHRKNLCIKEGGGRIMIFRRIFLSHSAENFRTEHFSVTLIS